MSAVATLAGERLHKRFRGKTALADVSINVGGGEVVGLLGPNGAGKTTCFDMMIGLLKPDGGGVTLNGEDISHLPAHERGRRGLAYLPQEKSVFADLTAAENVRAILELQPQPPANMKKAALRLLHDMGVEHLANEQADNLSGGERRRVEIARLLAMRPQFVLMDEPFAAIAPIAVRDLRQIIFSLTARGIGIFLTDHNVRETLAICQRAYILNEGKILAAGKAQALIDNEQARKVYLGEEFGL